jgi:hypothetical protein
MLQEAECCLDDVDVSVANTSAVSTSDEGILVASTKRTRQREALTRSSKGRETRGKDSVRKSRSRRAPAAEEYLQHSCGGAPLAATTSQHSNIKRFMGLVGTNADDAGNESDDYCCGEPTTTRSNALHIIGAPTEQTQCESTKDALRLVIDDDDDVFDDEFFSGPTLADCLAMAVLQEMPNLSTFQQFDEDASRAASSFQPPSVLLAKFTAEERQPGWCSTRRPMWQTFGIMTVVLLAMILGTISVAYLWK